MPTLKTTFTLIFLCFFLAQAQEEKKVSIQLFQGTVVAGYVDEGAYINCTGPSIKYSKGGKQILLGLLPSIKIKQDRSTVKNSTFMPSLGFGATATFFRKFAVQIPAFYVPKTASANGSWKLGVGIGYTL